MYEIAFKIQLHRGKADEFKRRHALVCKELTSSLCDIGVEEYSIFLDEELYSLIITFKIRNGVSAESVLGNEVMSKVWQEMRDLLHTRHDNSPFCVRLIDVFYPELNNSNLKERYENEKE